jgi:hypothetical protein
MERLFNKALYFVSNINFTILYDWIELEINYKKKRKTTKKKKLMFQRGQKGLGKKA